MKPSIVIIARLGGPVAEQIHELQRRYDPRMASELPPHLTLIGSSGLGPIAVRTPVAVLRDALAPVAARTASMSLLFGAPIRFMQSNVVVLPLDPHGALRVLHDDVAEALRAVRIDAEPARFTFTPHCTLNLYRELPATELRELLAVRISDPVEIDRLAAYRATNAMRTEELFSFPLSERAQRDIRAPS